MAGLEDLAAALLGQSTQAEIAKENPYYGLAEVPESLGGSVVQLMAKNPRKYSMKEGLAWGIGSGLLGGLLRGQGDSYQQKLTDRYTGTVADIMQGGSGEGSELSPGLFSSAQRAGTLFKLQQGLQRQELADKLGADLQVQDAKSAAELKNKIALMAVEDPEGAQRAMQSPVVQQLLGIKPQAQLVPVQSSEAEVEVQEPDPLGITPLQERRAEKNKFYRSQGYPREKAADAANNDLKGELEANKASFKKADELKAKAEEMINMADLVDSVLDQGLETGTGAEFMHSARKAGSIFGVGNEKATLGDMLNTIKTKSIVTNRVPGVGAMSDPEMRLYIQGGPSLDKTTETNRELASRMRQIGERSKDYVDFLQTVQEKGGTAAQADKLWNKYTRANPLWVKDGDGKLVPNASAASWTEFDFLSEGSGKTSGASGNWGESADTPKVGSTFEGKKVIRVTKVR